LQALGDDPGAFGVWWELDDLQLSRLDVSKVGESWYNTYENECSQH